jgi:thiamine-phosphate pyrophosphorylase
MPLTLSKPIIYLITDGSTTGQTTSASKDFVRLLKLVEAAVAARVSLIQLREKDLTTRVLYDLASKAAQITRDSFTRLLVNDRADVARAAGADGVHLTTRSMDTSLVRQAFGEHFLIGKSAHSLHEVQKAAADQADFAVFGPVFDTPSKNRFGQPQGLTKLAQVATAVKPFPVVALGGVSLENVANCFRAGSSGIAGIRLLNEASELRRVVEEIGKSFELEQ